ncbi:MULTISPECIES: hypothetical protein [Euryhalocaulis]|uniref:hypothetical protein n=1 Tax=Euryhalocaulis TaxID=1712422 RepID=UPI00039F4445|nr:MULTISPECIES: hypothetical protein [Euryhalocaulis]MBA4800339.1 hypothetical protein [Euryhalocaulis sp.]
MDTIMEWLRAALDFAQRGFAEINTIQYLIIALISALVMGGYGQIVIMSAIAVIVHVAVDALMPVIRSGGDLALFVLPNFLTGAFWQMAGLLYVGYFIAITVFFLIKALLFRARG